MKVKQIEKYYIISFLQETFINEILIAIAMKNYKRVTLPIIIKIKFPLNSKSATNPNLIQLY